MIGSPKHSDVFRSGLCYLKNTIAWISMNVVHILQPSVGIDSYCLSEGHRSCALCCMVQFDTILKASGLKM